MVSPELIRLLDLPETKQAIERARAQVVQQWAAAQDVAERERLWSLYHGIDAGMTALRAIAADGVLTAEREKRGRTGA